MTQYKYTIEVRVMAETDGAAARKFFERLAAGMNDAYIIKRERLSDDGLKWEEVGNKW